MYQIIRNVKKDYDFANISMGMEQNSIKVGFAQEQLEYLTFPGLSKIKGIRHLFSTRLGGVSKGVCATMNLSYSRGDEKEAVDENYNRIAKLLSIDSSQFVCSDQTHTTNVRVVTKEDMGKGVTIPKDYTDVDGLVTNEKGLALATFYADCVPLYFVDPVKQVIGLSHSGWKGTVARMGKATVEKMTEVYGCNPQDIKAAIGPSICKYCYEVSDDVRQAYIKGIQDLSAEAQKEALSLVFYQKDEKQIAENKYQMDLWMANVLVMLGAGILPENIEVTDICTAHNPDYLFSHRKTNGKRGNLAAFLMLTDE